MAKAKGVSKSQIRIETLRGQATGIIGPGKAIPKNEMRAAIRAAASKLRSYGAAPKLSRAQMRQTISVLMSPHVKQAKQLVAAQGPLAVAASRDRLDAAFRAASSTTADRAKKIADAKARAGAVAPTPAKAGKPLGTAKQRRNTKPKKTTRTAPKKAPVTGAQRPLLSPATAAAASGAVATAAKAAGGRSEAAKKAHTTRANNKAAAGAKKAANRSEAARKAAATRKAGGAAKRKK